MVSVCLPAGAHFEWTYKSQPDLPKGIVKVYTGFPESANSQGFKARSRCLLGKVRTGYKVIFGLYI
jgi:hypothetical protein